MGHPLLYKFLFPNTLQTYKPIDVPYVSRSHSDDLSEAKVSASYCQVLSKSLTKMPQVLENVSMELGQQKKQRQLSVKRSLLVNIHLTLWCLVHLFF